MCEPDSQWGFRARREGAAKTWGALRLTYLDIFHSPGFWGAAGAFMWASTDWLACASTGKGFPVRCSAEFLIRLTTGAIAGYAFTPWALWIMHDDAARMPPVATTIGLIANNVAPKVMDALTARAVKLFKGS